MPDLTIASALEQYGSALRAYPVSASSEAGVDFAARLHSKRNLAKVESAIGEALAWEYLRHRVGGIESIEPVPGIRTPDFLCSSSGSPFFVEVQVVTTTTVTRWTGLEARPIGPRPFGPVGTWAAKFQKKLSAKTTQGASVPLPRLIFFVTLHAEATFSRTWAVRHRLRRDPVTGAPEPLVYYVDRAAPEPVRSALVEGASWWEEAFAAAGYPGLFRVEVAPEGLDPLDARHNVIQWVHRSTRGWSYGNAVTDPRTGEIVKGHVSLGSLRVRQDRLLFEGLLGTQATGSGAPDDPVQLALARIRQLSAHEVGHTLGLAHNFAASVANRASVMDYPAPRVRPRPDGSLDVSEAYGVGVGAWDVHAIRMLYETAPADVAVEPFLARMSGEARDAGLLYLTDQDCRSAGASHPLGNLWDDGDEPISGLRNALEVRRIGLAAFGDRCLEAGRPTHELEEVLVPLYLHHRYQVDAALKVVGGRDYEHTMHGERDASVRVVPAGLQREALALLVSAAGPATLQLPRDLRDALPPRSPGAGPSREVFGRAAEASFDWLGAAEVAQRQVVRGLLQPERLARLHLQSRGEAADDQLGLAEVMGALVGAGMVVDGESGPAAALRARLRRVVIEELLGAMAGRTTPPEARDMARLVLVERLESGSLDDMPALEAAVSAALLRPAAPRPAGSLREAPTTPPGSPIGGGGGPWQGLAGAGGCSIDAD